MSDLIWLWKAQTRRIKPHSALAHGVPRVDDRLIVSGITFVIRNGLRWREAPAGYVRTRRSHTKAGSGIVHLIT